MDKKIILGTLGLIAFVISLLLMLPDNSVNTPETLPWNIAHPSPDTIRVFGVTLGKSSLAEAEAAFKEQSEISLFKPTEGKMSVEAFVDEVNFNGLKAKIAMTIAVPEEELQGMFQRGLRMNSGISGKHITLTFDDLARARTLPVSSLTYLPNVRLEEAIISKRFGTPELRIRETQSGVIHWLYPQHGLDIALGGTEKPLLQYLAPKDFDKLRAPLLANGEILK
jgi:hypothetical protein